MVLIVPSWAGPVEHRGGSSPSEHVMPKLPNLLVSAPGKMMIAGEYAVLHGAEALVAAVDRRAFARFRSGAAPEASRKAAAAFAEARKAAGRGPT
jgi:hypothetical protein